jgi:uncharacterized protein with HEPN domain
MKKIQNYVTGLEYTDFVENDLVIDAVVRNLEVIGEASKYISEDIRTQYSDIPWKKMVGLRNVIIHEYFGIDLGIVWEIITRNIPEVKLLLEKILKEIEKEEKN